MLLHVSSVPLFHCVSDKHKNDLYLMARVVWYSSLNILLGRKEEERLFQDTAFNLFVCLIKLIKPNICTRINHSDDSSSHPSDSEYKHRKDIFTSFLPVSIHLHLSGKLF